MKHKWWHRLFMVWQSSERERSIAHHYDAKWWVNKDIDTYYCLICRKEIEIDNLKESK